MFNYFHSLITLIATINYLLTYSGVALVQHSCTEPMLNCILYIV